MRAEELRKVMTFLIVKDRSLLSLPHRSICLSSSSSCPNCRCPFMLNAHRPSLDSHRRLRNCACRPTRTLESREQRMSANLVSTYRKKIGGTGCDISHSIDIDQC